MIAMKIDIGHGAGGKVGRTHLLINLPDLMLSSILKRHDDGEESVVGSKLDSSGSMFGMCSTMNNEWEV